MRRRPALVVAAVVALGCSGIQVKSTYDESVDFAQYRSFAQAPPSTERIAALPGYSAITAGNIQAAIGQELESKGFTSVPKGQADMFVAFSVSGKPRTDLTSTGWGYGWGTNVVTTHYVEGAMVIDIHDARSEKLIWHGWGTAQIFQSEVGKGKGEQAAREILAKFPPQPKQ